MPPRSKNGSKISSLVSLKTRDGGGRVEPARRQTSSQNSIPSASTISGGTTRTAVSRAILIYLSARGGRLGVIVTTGAAVVASTAVAGSVFMAGIFIESASPCSLGRPHASARSGLDQTSTRLMDRDFRYAAGFSGSNTLPSKKVSLPRDFDAGISAAATPRALVASPASYLPQRISSVRNQRSWLWNG